MNGFATRQHHPVTTALFVVIFWSVAAALVTSAHLEIEPRSPGAAAVATIGAMLVTAGGYMWLVARHAGVTHALGVGIAWLTLSIVAEIALTTHLGHAWFTLLGSPNRPLLRNIFLFAWIFAPALFARSDTLRNH